MRTTVDIIDALKKEFGVTSDYALSQKTGWGSSKISHYRKKKNYLGNYECYQASVWLKKPFLQILAIAEYERAKTPEQKREWGELAKAS